MPEPVIRIVKIQPMRAVLFHGFSRTPEIEAHDALQAWAGPKGLLSNRSTFFFFGRNNPPPSQGKEEYGYDSMVTVDPELEIGEGVQIEEIPGGLYAVARTNLTDIGEMWRRLYDWVRNSSYEIAGHGLEEVLTAVDETHPDTMLLDLWLPIAE